MKEIMDGVSDERLAVMISAGGMGSSRRIATRHRVCPLIVSQ